MSKNKQRLGVQTPDGKIHFHSTGEVGSVLATAKANAVSRNAPHRIVETDGSKLRKIGTVKPASNTIARNSRA